MLKKYIAYILGAMVLASSSLQAKPENEPTQSKPNVLMLLFDDMRFDTFSYRDGPVSTPNIDALANQGIQFNQAMTSTGLCSPSRAALFTGRWGHKNGLEDNIYLFHSRYEELPPEQGGLIKRAADEGYFVGYAGKWHLGAEGTGLRGADYVYDADDLHHERFERGWAPREIANKVKQYNQGKRDANGEKHMYYQTLPGTFKDTETARIVEHGQKMMRQAADKKQPFFGVVSFHQPHPPYRVPEPYASMFDPETVELPKNHLRDRVNKPMSQDEPYWPWHDVEHLTDTDWRKMRTFYYGAVAMLDDAVGQLIETAKEEGLYEDLYIVFAGDQGSMLGEHGLYDKGPYAYDELMRMPLFVRVPGEEPKTINRQVSMLDIAPTLGDWMRLPADGDVDGRSLVPLIKHGDKAEEGQVDKALYAYEWYNGGWFGIRAIRTPEYKFVWNPGETRDELYDLQKDPVEIENQIDNSEYQKVRSAMIELLEQELVRIEDPLLGKYHRHMKNYQ
ncbi:sulfatase-like hydrolase/transferase [Gilvimarinus chinensis]|uniref:sulfatase-like hydrolase/transferase n=1 Tax=Gilvimarinus chinensis TaxID=396005 RepID=UPI00037D36F3|nr:sulfatase-like hydrolase/transferase [Gilvimarinus chinensis]